MNKNKTKILTDTDNDVVTNLGGITPENVDSYICMG